MVVVVVLLFPWCWYQKILSTLQNIKEQQIHEYYYIYVEAFEESSQKAEQGYTLFTQGSYPPVGLNMF